jgi:hypothetical protein
MKFQNLPSTRGSDHWPFESTAMTLWVTTLQVISFSAVPLRFIAIVFAQILPRRFGDVGSRPVKRMVWKMMAGVQRVLNS